MSTSEGSRPPAGEKSRDDIAGSSTIGTLLLFCAAVFTSAFLIFIVQPMVGKHILPWFGGGTGVWTLCLAFYQVTLFLGYAYAHFVIVRVPPRRQLVVHALLFAVALLVLPVLPDASWKPDAAADPGGRILAMLAANVALPFLMLAATGPLVQAWFARLDSQRSPYPLYAVSNLGSLLALLSYPILVEPLWPLPVASRIWSGGFLACGAAVLACAWLASRTRRPPASDATSSTLADAPPAIEPLRRTGLAVQGLWVMLPACAVVILMGVTNKICLDVASIPFLWIAPLAVYLLTFIVCFGSERFYHRTASAIAGALVLVAALFLNQQTTDTGIPFVELSPLTIYLVVFIAILAVSCLLLHGELYRLRPPAQELTRYYLSISGGGAIGGLFVALGAPRLFDDYYELGIGLVGCWVLVALAWWRDPSRQTEGAGRVGVEWASATIGVGIAALIGLGAVRVSETVVLRHRNFYGILRILEADAGDPRRHRHMLRNGTTVHGAQFQDTKGRGLPTTYYGRAAGIGLLLESRNEDSPLRIGVVGLGVGTLATYGRAGDRFTFYEIDPDVIRLVRDEERFTFLRDSISATEVVAGDARLALERELESTGTRDFDLLVVDAFSSDAIPIHLITQQAFELYARHLRADGILALHVSNLHLKLAPIAAQLGEAVGMRGIEVRNQFLPRRLTEFSHWVFLCDEGRCLPDLTHQIRQRVAQMRLQAPDVIIRPLELDPSNPAPLWTDEYSNLFAVLEHARDRTDAPPGSSVEQIEERVHRR